MVRNALNMLVHFFYRNAQFPKQAMSFMHVMPSGAVFQIVVQPMENAA